VSDKSLITLDDLYEIVQDSGGYDVVRDSAGDQAVMLPNSAGGVHTTFIEMSEGLGDDAVILTIRVGVWSGAILDALALEIVSFSSLVQQRHILPKLTLYTNAESNQLELDMTVSVLLYPEVDIQSVLFYNLDYIERVLQDIWPALEVLVHQRPRLRVRGTEIVAASLPVTSIVASNFFGARCGRV
jgi:hypothetical protein